MPPCEGESEKKMYEVFCWVDTIADVNNFLGLTSKFSKRFYTVDYRQRDDPDKRWIYVKAIAISRDLTYILGWHIECEDVCLAPEDRFDDAHSEKPPFGFMPINKEPPHKNFLNEWFPSIDHGSYVDVFAYNGFIKVDEIKTDWKTTSLDSRW